MKKLISILLMATLMIATAAPAFAADGEATTIRLQKKEGTVSVKNKSGSAVSISDKMKLYSGYKLSTGTSSYAYLSLDSSKTAKLDASSSAEVKTSGSKLKVSLVSGKLLFNVAAPMKSGESLDVSSSTTITGVKGTAGFIHVLPDGNAIIYLLCGSVEITFANAETGQSTTVTLTAGQCATTYMTGDGLEIYDIKVSSFTADDVPGFVGKAIAEDKDLQDRIRKESDLDVDKIIAEWANKLAKEQTDADKQQAEIDKKLAEMKNETINELFKPDGSIGGGGGASGTTGTPYSNTIMGIYGTNVATDNGQIQAFLNDSANNAVILTGPAGETLNLSTPISVPAGKSLVFAGASTTRVNNQLGNTVTVASGATLTNEIRMANNGTVQNNGTFVSSGNYMEAGTFNNTSGNTLYVGEEVPIPYGGSSFTVSPGGVLNNTVKGRVVIQSSCRLEVASGGIINNGTSSSDTSVKIDNAGMLGIDSGGTVNNYAAINAQDDGVAADGDANGVCISGTLNNYGSLTVGEDMPFKIEDANLNNAGGNLSIEDPASVQVDKLDGITVVKGESFIVYPNNTAFLAAFDGFKEEMTISVCSSAGINLDLSGCAANELKITNGDKVKIQAATNSGIILGNNMINVDNGELSLVSDNYATVEVSALDVAFNIGENGSLETSFDVKATNDCIVNSGYFLAAHGIKITSENGTAIKNAGECELYGEVSGNADGVKMMDSNATLYLSLEKTGVGLASLEGEIGHGIENNAGGTITFDRGIIKGAIAGISSMAKVSVTDGFLNDTDLQSVTAGRFDQANVPGAATSLKFYNDVNRVIFGGRASDEFGAIGKSSTIAGIGTKKPSVTYSEETGSWKLFGNVTLKNFEIVDDGSSRTEPMLGIQGNSSLRLEDMTANARGFKLLDLTNGSAVLAGNTEIYSDSGEISVGTNSLDIENEVRIYVAEGVFDGMNGTQILTKLFSDSTVTYESSAVTGVSIGSASDGYCLVTLTTN